MSLSRTSTLRSGESDRAAMIAWMDQGNEMVIQAGGAWQPVAVVRIEGAVPYLRAHLNGQWTDGLLELPMF